MARGGVLVNKSPDSIEHFWHPLPLVEQDGSLVTTNDPGVGTDYGSLRSFVKPPEGGTALHGRCRLADTLRAVQE
jgi:hypothetical protein